MTNQHSCGMCEHFDVVLNGTRKTSWGWCAKKSVYPHLEGPGQVFPAGVARVLPGELAKPHMVRAEEVVPLCETYLHVIPKPDRPKLIETLQIQGVRLKKSM